jgi:hypothetical protein
MNILPQAFHVFALAEADDKMQDPWIPDEEWRYVIFKARNTSKPAR